MNLEQYDSYPFIEEQNKMFFQQMPQNYDKFSEKDEKSIATNLKTVDPCASPIKAPKFRKSRKQSQDSNKIINHGHWSLDENKKYHWFLEIHYKHFVNRHLRRMDKIFKTMEIFVQTRQAQQCRSHHQKMQKKYLNFASIIMNLRNQHYKSVDINFVAEDIGNSEIPMEDDLCNMEDLFEIQGSNPQTVKDRRKIKNKQKKLPTVQCVIKQQENQSNQIGYDVKVESQEEDKPEVEEKVNMFEDSKVQICDMIDIEHEKFENSSIFNVFQ